MVQRNFAGRGMTLAQLNKATQAERARKAAATAQILGQTSQVNQVNQAAANAAAETTAQTQRQQAQQAQQKQAPALQLERFSRQGPVDPNSRWAVHGTTLSQDRAAEEAAKAQAAAAANASVNNALVGSVTGSSTPYYDIDSSLNDIYKQASAAGVSIPKPTTYGKSITDAAKAQAIIDSYVKTANTAIAEKSKAATEASTVYDVTSQYDDIYNQAKGYGVNVAKPAQTQFKTQAAAQSALDDYVSKVNKALENAPAPTYENIDPQKTSGYSYVYTLSHKQQNALIRENDYRRQNGKPELSEYDFRKQEGVPVTTQQGGSYVKPKLTNKSVSSNGSGTVKAVSDGGLNGRSVAPIKSGDIKLAQVKANSTGISADNKKVTVLSASQAKQIKAQATAAKKAQATAATVEAKKAQDVAVQAKQEATAKQKAATSAQAAAKKSTSATEKAALKKEATALQKQADTAKAASKVADAHAQSTAKLADATKKAASLAAAPAASSKVLTEAAKSVKTAQSKVAKTGTAALKAGVQDHTGQVLLKNGVWIDQVQKVGGQGKGEGSIKLFGTTVEFQKQLTEQYKDKLAGKATAHVLTPSFDNAIKETQKAVIEAQKVADAYKKAHGTLNNIEISGGRNASEQNVIFKSAANAEGLQYTQSAAALYALEKNANKKITAAMERRAAAGSTADTEKISDIQSAREFLLNNVSAADARKLRLKFQKIDGKNTDWTAGFKSAVLEANPKTGESAWKARAASFADVQAFKTVNQLKKEAQDAEIAKKVEVASAEARKINPNGSQEYFEGVANSTRRSNLSTREVLAEDWQRGNQQISEKVTKPAVGALRAGAGKVDTAVQSTLGNISISVNDKGQIAIDRKGKESLKNRTTLNAGEIYSNTEKSFVVQGIHKFVNDELEEIATKPLNYAAEAGAMVVGGEILGAGYGGAKVLMKLGGKKVAGKVANAATKKFVENASAHVLDAVMAGTMVGGFLSNEAAYSKTRGNLESEAKHQADIEHTAGLMTLGKEFALGGIGFSKGAKLGEAATEKALALGKRSAIVNIPRATGLENALPSEFDVTDIKRYAPKPKTRTTAEKITTLKKQVNALKNSTKSKDIAKVKELKRQINAYEAKNKNISVVSNNKMKNRSDIKEIADNQAFDQRLIELKEMKAVADVFDASLINKIPPTEADLAGALKSINPSTKAKIDRMQYGWDKVKTATQLVKQNGTKVEYARDLPFVADAIVKDLSKVVKTAEKRAAKQLNAKSTKINRFGKSQVSALKKFKSTGVKEKINQFAESERLKEASNRKAALKAKIHDRAHTAYKLRSKARAIENGLEKARINFDVSKEAYYTAKAAKFRLENGISTKTAAKSDSINTLIGKTRAPSNFNKPRVNGYTLRKTSEQAVHSHNLARLGDSAKFVKNADPAEVEAMAAQLDQADFANDWMAPRKEVLARKVKDTTKSDSEFDAALFSLKQTKEASEMKQFADSWMEPKQRVVNVRTISDKELENTLESYEKTKLSYKRNRQQKYEQSRKLAKAQRLTTEPEFEPAQDITNIAAINKAKTTPQAAKKQMHSELQNILRDAKALKEFKNKPADITNVAAYRKARATPVKLTAKDVALFKAENEGKLTANKSSSSEWKSLKSQAAEYNKKVEAQHKTAEIKAQKRAAVEKLNKMTDAVQEALQSVKEPTKAAKNRLAWEKAHERILRERSKAKAAKAEAKAESKKQFEDIHFEKWLETQRQKSAIREEKAGKAESPDAKLKEDRHFEAWERIQKEKSVKRELEKEYRESPEFKEKQEKHFEARERAAKRKASNIDKEKEYRESPEYKAKEEKHFEAWERKQVEKMLKRETTPKKEELQNRSLSNVFSAPEMTKAKAELIAKRVAEANEYIKTVDVAKFGKNPRKDFEAKKRQAEIEKNVEKANEYIKTVDIEQFGKNSRKEIEAKKRQAEIEKNVAKANEYMKTVDVEKFGKNSRKEIEAKKRQAEIEKNVEKANEYIKTVDIEQFGKNSSKEIEAKRKEVALNKAVENAKKRVKEINAADFKRPSGKKSELYKFQQGYADPAAKRAAEYHNNLLEQKVQQAKKRMQEIDVTKFEKSKKLTGLEKAFDKMNKKSTTDGVTPKASIKRLKPAKSEDSDFKATASGSGQMLLQKAALKTTLKPKFKATEEHLKLLKNPDKHLKSHALKKQLKIKSNESLKTLGKQKQKQKLRKMKTEEKVKEAKIERLKEKERVKTEEKLKQKRAMRSGWFATTYHTYAGAGSTEYESNSVSTSIHDIIRDFNSLYVGPSNRTTPNIRVPTKVNIKPVTGNSYKVTPNVKTPNKINVKPIVGPTHKTTPEIRTPTKTDVRPVVTPIEYVPPVIKNTVIPSIKEDIIPDIQAIISVIPIVTPDTKNDYRHNRVDVTGIYLSNQWVQKRKKLPPTKEFTKKNWARVHLTRDITNRLGNLSSFFDTGSNVPTKSKKSVKRTGKQ